MSAGTEPFFRVKIDPLLRDADWGPTDGSSVLYEHMLPDGTRSDSMRCDRQGRPLAVLEAKRTSTDPATACAKGCHHAEQLGVPFVFLSNGEEVRFRAVHYRSQTRQGGANRRPEGVLAVPSPMPGSPPAARSKHDSVHNQPRPSRRCGASSPAPLRAAGHRRRPERHGHGDRIPGVPSRPAPDCQAVHDAEASRRSRPAAHPRRTGGDDR